MLRDLVAALRALTRRPTFALLAVALMALGIGLTTTAFGAVDGLLLQPPPYDHPERILVLTGAHQDRGLTGAALSYPDVVDLHASSHSLAAVAAVRTMHATVTEGPRAARVTGARVSPAFFRVFGVRPQLGRTLLPGEDAPTAELPIVLSARAWQAWFAGQPAAIGRTLTLDGQRYMVVGVMPAWFEYPTGAEYWIPFVPEPFAADRGSRYLSAVARLAPGASVDGARADLRAIAARLAAAYPAADAGWQLDATPVQASLTGDLRPVLALAAAAAALVLLIACANVASLLFARAAAREVDLAVRRALGATAGRLVRQALVESVLLALAGAAVGAVIAQVAAGGLRAVLPEPVPAWVSFAVHLRTLGFVVAVALLAGVLAGIAPALRAVRDRTSGPLIRGLTAAGRGSATVRQSRMQRGIVVAQMALATTVLAGAGLLSASLLRLRAVPPGFDPQGVITAQVTLTGLRYTAHTAQARFYTDVLSRLRALPGVQAAGATDGLPLASGTNRFLFTLPGEPRPAPGHEPAARRAEITPGYLATLHIPVIRGRDVDDRDEAGRTRVALVSASWARQFLPGRDPLGRSIQTADGQVATIVGVVGDVRHDGLESAGEPTVYTPFAQDPGAELTLVARAACDTPSRSACRDGAQLAPAVRRVVAAVDPGVAAYAVATMPEVVRESLAGRRVGVTLGGILAFTALLLASAGVYGLLALRVALRRREVGIRLALGARPRDVRRLVLGEGVRLAAVGSALGLAVAVLAGRGIAGLLYGVTATHVPTLLLVGVVMLGVAALASWGPARRAARVSPASALRGE